MPHARQPGPTVNEGTFLTLLSPLRPQPAVTALRPACKPSSGTCLQLPFRFVGRYSSVCCANQAGATLVRLAAHSADRLAGAADSQAVPIQAAQVEPAFLQCDAWRSLLKASSSGMYAFLQDTCIRATEQKKFHFLFPIIFTSTGKNRTRVSVCFGNGSQISCRHVPCCMQAPAGSLLEMITGAAVPAQQLNSARINATRTLFVLGHLARSGAHMCCPVDLAQM